MRLPPLKRSSRTRLRRDVAALDVRQVLTQQRAGVDQAMGEGSLYAPLLAALAVKQAEGDTMEAAFLLRAYRSTLPRLGYSLPMDGNTMRVRRRISSTFKDVPGGQVLGRTRDYTQRLFNFALLETAPAVGGCGEGGRQRNR